MIYSTSRFSHISSFLRHLHWSKARERIIIVYKLAVLVYKCLHGTGPTYLVDELSHSPDFESRRRLRSASSLNLIARRTRLSTYGDRTFPIARLWNSLPTHVKSASSVNIFRTGLKTFLLSRSKSLIILINYKAPVRCLWHFGHYNRSLLLLLLLLLTLTGRTVSEPTLHRV